MERISIRRQEPRWLFSEIPIREQVEDTPVGELEVSTRLRNVLRAIDCRTLKDLRGMRFCDVLEARSCGWTTVTELRALLSNRQDEEARVPNTISVSESIADIPVKDIPMSVRLSKALRSVGCSKLGDIDGMEIGSLARLKNCGRGTVAELMDLISKLSLSAGELMGMAPQKLVVPKDLRSLPLARLSISTRLSSALAKLDCHVLGDLEQITPGRLLVMKNCGPVTIHELHDLLRRAQSGQLEVELNPLDSREPESLAHFLDTTLSILPRREREILLRRFGAHDHPATLEELGRDHGLSRERVRQLVRSALTDVRRSLSPVNSQFLSGFRKRCTDAVCPLTPSLFALWHSDLTRPPQYSTGFYVSYLVQLVPDIVTWPGNRPPTGHLTGISARIDRALVDVLLEGRPAIPLKEAYGKLIQTRGLGWLTVAEFLGSLRLSPRLSIDLPSPTTPTVRLTRLSSDEIAKRTLNEAAVPLTPEEIIERTRARAGDEIELPSANSLANHLLTEEGYFLLDKHRFGTKKHFRLPKNDFADVRDRCYAALSSEGKPMATYELLDGLDPRYRETTTIYELAEVLRADERFRYLKRLLFSLAEWDIHEREYVKDLLPQVLEGAARPLSASEIWRALKRRRSVTATAMSNFLRDDALLTAYGYGYYGLKDHPGNAMLLLLKEPTYVHRAVLAQKPPLSFGDLCEALAIPPRGELSDALWDTLTDLPRIEVRDHISRGHATVRHTRWGLEQILAHALLRSGAPMSSLELGWEVQDLFGEGAEGASHSDVRRCLDSSPRFLRTPRGEYLLDEQVNEADFIDHTGVADAVAGIMAESKQLYDADCLLTLLEEGGLDTDGISSEMLTSILRGNPSFDEISAGLFRFADEESPN